MLWTPDSSVLFGDGELVFGQEAQGFSLSNAVLTNTEVSVQHRGRRVGSDHGPEYYEIYGDSYYDVTMKFMGVPSSGKKEPRKELLRRRCADMTVNELLGVVNWKLRQRREAV